MNNKMFATLYEYYKEHYGEIEKQELYKWESVVHFKDNWDIEAEDFANMLEKSLKKTYNLMSSGNYYPRRMIVWAAKKEPEIVRELFKMLYDLSLDLKERIEDFRNGIDSIVEKHKEGKVSKSYQDDRAIMVYLNMMYPEKYYLYKYTMFTKFAKLIDYAELPNAGDIELIFLFNSMCEMILQRVKEDTELLEKYEARKQKYYDPDYHLLVQDIIYSAEYYTEGILPDEEKKIHVKNFMLETKPTQIKLAGSHVDFIEKGKKDKSTGDSGEEFVYQFEREKVKKLKLPKAKQVERKSVTEGDGLGYDVLSYDEHGKEMFIEVKTTTGPEKSPIFITVNELEMSEQNPDNYYLYRVYNFDSSLMKGDIAIRKGSLKPLCTSAQTYKVEFK